MTAAGRDSVALDSARQDWLERLGRIAATQMAAIIADVGDIEDVHTFRVNLSGDWPTVLSVTVGEHNVVFNDHALRGMLERTDWNRSPAFVAWTRAMDNKGLSLVLLHVKD